MTIQKKIANKIKEKKGITLIGILLGAVAFGLLAFPMARWVIQMTQNIAANERSVAALGAQLEMQAIMEDRWHIINDMSIDQLKAATTKTTTYGKYSVKEEYATAGKYNASTGACASGTASGTEQLCRQVTLTVTGPAGTTPLGPVKAIRVATPSSRIANLETRVAAAEKKFGDYSTTSQINSTLGNYYTKSQINSTLGSYATTAAVSTALGNYYTKGQVYSKSEVDSKDTTINNKFISYYTKTEADTKVAAAVSGSGSGAAVDFSRCTKIFPSGAYRVTESSKTASSSGLVYGSSPVYLEINGARTPLSVLNSLPHYSSEDYYSDYIDGRIMFAYVNKGDTITIRSRSNFAIGDIVTAPDFVLCPSS